MVFEQKLDVFCRFCENIKKHITIGYMKKLIILPLLFLKKLLIDVEDLNKVFKDIEAIYDSHLQDHFQAGILLSHKGTRRIQRIKF